MKTQIRSVRRTMVLLLCAILLLVVPIRLCAIEVGVAKIDISPTTPIRLSGYGSRRTESEAVAQRLWSKALALGNDIEGAALLITVDNCGISTAIADEVAARLRRTHKIPRERIAICSTHTHTGPSLKGVLPNLFSEDISPEHQAHIDQYTQDLILKMEQVASSALADRRPGEVEWAEGKVEFARNRRTPNGPVDHALPVLKVIGADGRLRGLLANYACHCTTLGGDFNQAHGDWAGCAQEIIERDHPGAIGFLTSGCGADSNPQPRNKIENVSEHGEEVAEEVNRLLHLTFNPLKAKLDCRAKEIELPFQTHFTREQWELRARQSGIVGYHARKNLARLDRGETLPTKLPYRVQTWNFGNDLAFVFLPGEVVVDYDLRLKQDFDSSKLWVCGYANGVPCYIPSRRILKEGGYEAEDSLWYYDRPARLAPESEDMIVAAVHDLMPHSYDWSADRNEFPPSRSPAEALASFRTRAELTVELVASEPLVIDPVAIDFGSDGKLWVAEMHDYPMGLDGNWKPGGRVKFLEDTDGDGRYDKATVLLDGLPFPTGLMTWKKGVLICAAPDIIYAEDTNGDGRADVVTKMLTGFATENFQARVNGLRWGLDNWVYGSSGLFGRKISIARTGQTVDVSGRDFRFRPDTGEFEPAHGLTQQPRVRDDWGEWFGCDNSTLLWHYPLPEQYVRRNPHVTAPQPRVYPPKDADSNRVYPTSRALTRFNDPASLNHVTSGCGVEIYRDNLLGAGFYGNAFTCEPVHNLVHRLVLSPDGVTFSARRAPDEERSEFLSSTDNWFRPVEARTGPDGALWIVDMYRFVVEHPRWIAPERLAKLDVRAGSDKGRIYRVYPKGGVLRPVRNLKRLSPKELLAGLEAPNGPTRDLIHRELFLRHDKTTVPALAKRLPQIPLAAGRVQALGVLEGLRGLSPELLEKMLVDPEPLVRCQAVRLSEPFLDRSPRLANAVLKLVSDGDVRIRYQVSLSLGEWNDRRAAEALGAIACSGLSDPWLQAAVLSSATRFPDAVLTPLWKAEVADAEIEPLVGQLLATAVAGGDKAAVAGIWLGMNSGPREVSRIFRMRTLASLLNALERRNVEWPEYFTSDSTQGPSTVAQMKGQIDAARQLLRDQTQPEDLRTAAVYLLGREPEVLDADLRLLVEFAVLASPHLQTAAFDRLNRQRGLQVPGLLLPERNRCSLSARSAVVGLLLNRDEWADELLTAVEKGAVSPGEISPAHRQRLLTHPNPALRIRAGDLLSAHRSESRAQVLVNYQGVVGLSGDSAHGSVVFENNCSSCHFLRGRGQAVGPNLAEFQGKAVQDFMVAILDPNAALEPKFVTYQIETKDGRSLSGIVKGESATSLSLIQGGGTEEKILRGDIVEMKASKLSLMPEGLEQNISTQDLADLIAFIKDQHQAAFGSADADRAAKARAAFSAAGATGLVKVVSASEQLDYPSWVGKWPMSVCRQSDGQSKIVWQTAAPSAQGDAKVPLKFRFPAALGFFSQPSGKFQLKINGQPALDFDVTLHDGLWQGSDGKVRVSYLVMERNDEDSNGVLLIEVPPSLTEAGQPVTFEVSASAAHSQRWFGLYQVPLTVHLN